MAGKKFAVFDIDGTIARSALFFQVVDELIVRGYLPAEYREKLDEKYERYRQRTHAGAFNEYAQVSVEALLGNVHKLRAADYREAVDAVTAKTSKYVYTYTRDLIRKLKDQGYFLIALSGSEMYSVKRFTGQFDFDVAIGELYHEKDGVFTGEIEEVIHKKDIFIKQLVSEHGLSYKSSIAVGDSIGDKEMLEIVEYPVAFNPEQRLYDLALKNKWKIVVERKNVIYELVPRRTCLCGPDHTKSAPGSLTSPLTIAKAMPRDMPDPSSTTPEQSSCRKCSCGGEPGPAKDGYWLAG
ncbi:MAG: HAD-IB family hydrolase [Candidatus Saccharimonadales bacterium]